MLSDFDSVASLGVRGSDEVEGFSDDVPGFDGLIASCSLPENECSAVLVVDSVSDTAMLPSCRVTAGLPSTDIGSANYITNKCGLALR